MELMQTQVLFGLSVHKICPPNSVGGAFRDLGLITHFHNYSQYTGTCVLGMACGSRRRLNDKHTAHNSTASNRWNWTNKTSLDHFDHFFSSWIYIIWLASSRYTRNSFVLRICVPVWFSFFYGLKHFECNLVFFHHFRISCSLAW